MIFSRDIYDRIASLAFSNGYPGYRPHVTELPNGDGKPDAGKKYSHIALKYLLGHPYEDFLTAVLASAHFEACRVAEVLQVPAEYYPRVADGTLRILEYPAGVGSEEHTDFDLFTILCYRETVEDLVVENGYFKEKLTVSGPVRDRRAEARKIDPHMHIGELGELVGLGPATPHRVVARPYVQRSIVYFAMSDHEARLTQQYGEDKSPIDGPRTVGEWLKERMARSRAYK
jgi:hypothetical protein